MANLTKKETLKDIDSNITEAFAVIDNYLPARYTNRVIQLVPGVTPNFVRHVRCKRKGPTKIVAALKKIALEEKEIIT